MMPHPPPTNAAATATRQAKPGGGPARARGRNQLAAGLCVLLLAGACSDDKPRTAGQGTPAAATEREAAPARPLPTTADDDYARNDQQAGPGNWFRVVAERAYFFDAPRAEKPNGRYLLRGDVLYADDEVNRYVKTSFKQPNGASAAGWLKLDDLGRLARKPAVAAAPRNTQRQQPTPPPAPAAAEEPYSYELEPAASEQPRQPRQPREQPTGAGRAVVAAERSYFYNSPDLTDRRKAHCVRGDKVRLGEEQGEAVYVTFTNWQGVTSRGWMRKNALQINP
ncbi:hypothetical protein [Hymenobacter latericus]|uniref:hypothetical protein n=1 Tax=Hymenobacter sp. YIM 151858-1 TaxID=2987688 RepID=UPI002227DE7A|nr:hypothetical protein [Hymenobacter sp. YIM 151858-1]UYZ60745.1 hypothetical protein OIS50_08070 [Hymenobacter sp. YIM 151858-1]